MKTDLWTWTAVDLANAIRNGKVSSREALESCLARVDEINPRINAIVDMLTQEARVAADVADQAVKAGEVLGPLHGVPITIKINVDYAGRPTTNGSAALKNLIAEEDSIPVANLKKAGAVIFGRTNVPGLSTRYFTDNEIYGRTLNPWDASRTPGGSSGGAAAAVSTGMCAIGHGNDRAGSIRYPAYACGVVGLRPSLGRVPDMNPTAVKDRMIGTQLTNVQGPLARTVADARLALAALAASDVRDPWWVPAPLDFMPAPENKRVAMFKSLPVVDIDPDVANAVAQAGQWLEEAGYTVEEAEPPRFIEVAEMFWTLLMTEERTFAPSQNPVELYGDTPVKRARASQMVVAGQYNFNQYILTLAQRTTILREWQRFLDHYPLVLLPVSFQKPFPIDEDQKGDEPMRRLIRAQGPLIAISILGLPGLSVPTSLVDSVPMGVQLVAGRYQEERCLRAGEAIEQFRQKFSIPIDPR
jgi:amidase